MQNKCQIQLESILNGTITNSKTVDKDFNFD